VAHLKPLGQQYPVVPQQMPRFHLHFCSSVDPEPELPLATVQHRAPVGHDRLPSSSNSDVGVLGKAKWMAAAWQANSNTSATISLMAANWLNLIAQSLARASRPLGLRKAALQIGPGSLRSVLSPVGSSHTVSVL